MKCQEVLKLKEDGLSCEMIAKKMNFKRAQISKDKVFRWRKRLLHLINHDEEYIQVIEEEWELIKINY